MAEPRYHELLPPLPGDELPVAESRTVFEHVDPRFFVVLPGRLGAHTDVRRVVGAALAALEARVPNLVIYFDGADIAGPSELGELVGDLAAQNEFVQELELLRREHQRRACARTEQLIQEAKENIEKAWRVEVERLLEEGIPVKGRTWRAQPKEA